MVMRLSRQTQKQRGEAAMSFYSGHVSVVFAVATAYSRLLMLRRPTSPWIVPSWVLGQALGAGFALLRVVSGSHFPSDVLVGAATGVGFGLLIPWLHERPRGRGRGESPRPVAAWPYFAGAMAGVSGSF